ncbi:MAG: hypothetical protein MUF64_07205 [Polyangiaceae bacterium]|jgi:hypothetical protein|nr:hypothetical protein [Polyangiaceae bacterium]
MAPSFLQLEGFLRASPAVALPALAGALGEAGGFVVAAHPLGNLALSITFELDAPQLPALAGALERAGVVLFSGAAGAIQGLAGRSGEVTGQLLVTLIHERADDPAPIPSIPG